jgi:hypothetical protein
MGTQMCPTKTNIMNIAELRLAIENKIPLVWNDPDPIDGNDYTIEYIEDLTDIDNGEDDFEWDYTPILIQYGGGSEAEVFLCEILLKN